MKLQCTGKRHGAVKNKRLDSGGRTRNKTVGLNRFLVERPDLSWVQNVDHLSLGPFGEWTARELR